MENKNIFERILYVIEKEGLTIASFSKKIGVGDQTIRSIVSYQRNYPGYEVLLKILQTFEWVDANWLITGITKDGCCDDPLHSQQRTIENLSETIKNLTSK